MDEITTKNLLTFYEGTFLSFGWIHFSANFPGGFKKGREAERNKNIPKAGFAAGPCLLKDTMQLSSFVKKKFTLGYSAMNINEGLPNFMVKKLGEKYNLKKMSVGILGLSFKADIDDTRDSLSFKLHKILKKKCKNVLVSDEHYVHTEGITKETLIKKSNIIILAVPHKEYKNLKFPKKKIIIDTWGIIKK